jgi:hypothetical protein
MADDARRLYGVQFHPEVTHTAFGSQILRNFLFKVRACRGDWTMEDFVSASIERYRPNRPRQWSGNDQERNAGILVNIWISGFFVLGAGQTFFHHP